MTRFHRILVATDFSPASLPAFERALELSKESGAVLLVAHSISEHGPPEIGYAPASGYEEWKRHERASAESRLQPLVERARGEGVEASALVLTGLADEAIVEAARREEADLVVLGTHGRRGAERFFLGSVASRVVLSSACPVITVRPQQGGPEGAKPPA